MTDEQAPPRQTPTTSAAKGIGGHLTRIFVVLILLIGVVGTVIFWQRHRAAPEPEAAASPPPAQSVRILTVTPERVPLVPRYLGQTEASQSVEIRARVDGFLESRNFEEGGAVTAGQLLFEIDRRQYQAELDVARAELASAEARADRAARQVARYEELIAQRAATPSELDEWQTELRLAQAQIQLAVAHIAQAELDLGYTRVESPIEGVIGEAERDVGSFVGPQQNGGLLAVVDQVDPIRVRFSVSEADILRWQRQVASGEVESPGVEQMQVRVELGDGSVFPHMGRISFMGVRIDPSTGSSVILAEIPNPDGRLVPGQFCHVSIQGITQNNQILVPHRAVIQNPTGAFVYVVDDAGAAQFRAVELGDWVGDRVVVRSGLRAGERVILDRLLTLRPGAPVTEAPADAARPGKDD